MKCVKEKRNHEKILRATCKKCGSEWEAPKVDIERVDPREGAVFLTQTCTICKTYGLKFS